MTGFAYLVGAPDGSAWLTDELGTDGDGAEIAVGLGAEVGRRLLAAGAGELLS